MSSPPSSLDLNLAYTGQTTGGMTNLPTFITPISVLTPTNDSVMENPTTALRVASHLLTPRDHELLARRSDHMAVDETLRLNMQATASVMNLRHRLLSRSVETESLRAQVASLRNQLRNSMSKVERLKAERKELKRENNAFREEHTRLCLIVSKYQTDMRRQLGALQDSGERLESEQKKLVSSVPSTSNPRP